MVAPRPCRHFRAMFALLQEAIVQPTPWHWVAFSFAIAGWALAALFVTRLVTRGGAPASTLLWVVVILLAPWIGLVLYYLMPRRLQLRRLRRRRNHLSWIEGELDRMRSVEAGPPHESALERLLHHLDADAVHDGNEVRWLAGGAEFFEAALAAIAAAVHSIHFEMYIFRSDASGRRLLAALAAAARRGVEVRLLFDAVGSFALKHADLRELRAAGGKAESFLPLLWKRRPFTLNLRNHRKLLVVDGGLAFLGGRNVGDEYVQDRLGVQSQWLDAMVAIQGPAVGRLQRVFVEDWYNAANEDLAVARYFPPVPRAGDDTVGVVQSGPDRDRQGLWWATFHLLTSAQRTIDLSSPYLLPPPTLLFALKVAAGRGVRVRVLTNGPAAEAFVLQQAQRSYYRELLDAGIELYETISDYNHTKVLVVDGSTMLVGSANLDMRSAHLNFEVAVVVPSARVAQAALATLEQRAGLCRRIDRAHLRRGALRKLVEGVCRLLSPVL